jgi:hypothetical protein
MPGPERKKPTEGWGKRMRRFGALFILAGAMFVGSPQPSFASCLAAPYPSTPTEPTYVIPNDSLDFVFWRQQCQDGSGQTTLLVRVTPLPAGDPAHPFCGTDFQIVQNGAQIGARTESVPGGSSFCGNLPVATTFRVLALDGGPTFDASKAFTLIWGSVNNGSVDLPALVQAPEFVITPTGCTPCHGGQMVGYRIDFTNTGPPVSVELKGGARLPDGSGLPFLSQVSTIPSGPSSITLIPTLTLPTGLPTIDVVIEAAILDPIFGITLNRQDVTLHLGP